MSPRTVLLIFIIFFLLLTPEPRIPTVSQKREHEDRVSHEQQALNVLNRSDYGALDATNNRWLNLTGLRKNDSYAWDNLPNVKERVREQLRTILEASPATLKPGNESKSHNGAENPVDLGKAAFGGGVHATAPFKDPLPIYQNVTGIVRGKWTQSKHVESHVPQAINLTALVPSVEYQSKKYNRNITGSTGDLRITLNEVDSHELLSEPGMIREVEARINIMDDGSSGDSWSFTMYGVHFIKQGGIVLTTTSEKFDGIFALPHFTISRRAYQLTRDLLNQTLLPEINKQESRMYRSYSPWESSPRLSPDRLFPMPECEYIVFLQQYPSDDLRTSFEDLEQELRFPTGASLPSVPPLKMSALVFSPDCGFVLESKGPPDYAPQEGLHLKGEKLEPYLYSAKLCILAFALLFFGQIFLLKRQMNDTSTPSTRSRVSLYTIAIMAMGDGLACIWFVLIGLFIDSQYIALTSAGFLCFLNVSFFGMKFLMHIWTVQAPERLELAREQQRARDQRIADTAAQNPETNTAPSTSTLDSNPIITAAGSDTLPLPATARRAPNTTPIILPPDQDLDAAATEDNIITELPTTLPTLAAAVTVNTRRELGALYIKFYFILLCTFLLSMHASTWPPTPRSLYCNTLSFLYLSLWLPQINRNITRNCRRALRWDFVIGQSLLRLAPFAYFYTVENNILFVSTSRSTFYVLAAWVWLQVWALASQEILGPRFFVPEGYAPPAYEYHPVLREGDSETAGTLPIGFAEAVSPAAVAEASSSSPTTPRSSNSREEEMAWGEHRKVFTCAICTENLDVPVVPSGDGGDGGRDQAAKTGGGLLGTTIFARREYMVTPCRHIFHTPCLEGWMRYRLQCPICREALPPL